MPKTSGDRTAKDGEPTTKSASFDRARFTRFPGNQDSEEISTEPAASGLPVATDKGDPRLKRLVTLFLLTLFVPVIFYVGTLYLNPHRVFLTVAFVPLIIAWAGNPSIGFGKIDWLMLGFVFWMAVSLIANHGFQRIQLIGMNTIETLGAYMAGRVLVRGAGEYNRVLKVLSVALLVFLPVAFLESMWGIRVFSKIADAIGQTYNWAMANPYYQKRLGLNRAQLVFEHPILFGFFATTTFGLMYFSTRPDGRIHGLRRAIFSIGCTFFALSSGPLLSLMTQIGIVTWDKIMRGLRNHWKVLIGLVIFAYIFVDALSNRTPFEVFISYMTFNATNGYVRIAIFQAGIQNVWAHPIFGIGMHPWVRPSWLPPSVDNFWLLMGMRHGIPGFILVSSAILGTIIGLGRLQLADPVVALMRKGAVVSFVGLSVTLMTVHTWGPSYVFICFMLGAVGWMKNHASSRKSEDSRFEATATTQSRRAGLPRKTEIVQT